MKTIEKTYKDGGKEKTYILKRMSMMEGDEWARLVIKSIISACPDALINASKTISLAQLGMRDLAQEKGAEEILSGPLFSSINVQDENIIYQKMYKQIKAKDASGERDLIDTDIQDPETLVKLRMDVFKLHMDFIKAEASQITSFGERLKEVWEVLGNPL